MRQPPKDRVSTLRLADGRRITYTATGPRAGLPVFYCHRAIGSPLGSAVDLEQLTERLGIQARAPAAVTAAADAVLPVIERHPQLPHRVMAAHAAPAERAALSRPEERGAASLSFLDATAFGVGAWCWTTSRTRAGGI